jgi:hypothetical protein
MAGFHHTDPGELRTRHVVHRSPHNVHQRVLNAVLLLQASSEFAELLGQLVLALIGPFRVG